MRRGLETKQTVIFSHLQLQLRNSFLFRTRVLHILLLRASILTFSTNFWTMSNFSSLFAFGSLSLTSSKMKSTTFPQNHQYSTFSEDLVAIRPSGPVSSHRRLSRKQCPGSSTRDPTFQTPSPIKYNPGNIMPDPFRSITTHNSRLERLRL